MEPVQETQTLYWVWWLFVGLDARKRVMELLPGEPKQCSVTHVVGFGRNRRKKRTDATVTLRTMMKLV